MITLQNKILQNQTFNNALLKLEKTAGLDMATNYKIVRILRALRKESALLQDMFVKLVKEHAELDEKGEPVPNKDSEGKFMPGTFVIKEEKKDEYKKAREDFDNLTFDVKVSKIPAKSLDVVGITPGDLSAIDMFIDFGDLEDAIQE